MAVAFNVNFDQLLFKLACLYAFFIPLERILKVFFSIDTVLKPYRIVAILMVILFVVKLFYRWSKNREIKQDIFFYSIFIYGGLITIFRMITTKFHMGYLFNDLFQMGMYLAVFIVLRHINLDREKVFTIVKYLSAGIVVNAIYVFYNFYFNQTYKRQGGFMDNPNYLALSLVIVMVLLMMRRHEFKKVYQKLAWVGLILFLAYIFISTGSRTGFGLLALCFTIMFIFFSIRQKLTIAIVAACVILFFQFGGQKNLESTGPLILIKRLNNKTSSEDVRFDIWRGVIKAAQETSFAGLGVGQFKSRFREFYYDENNALINRIIERNYFLSPHSDYMAIFAIYGIVGLICYLIFLFLTGKKILYHIYYSETNDSRIHYQFSLLIWIVIVIFGLTSESFNSALFWILLSICSTIGLSVPNGKEIQNRRITVNNTINLRRLKIESLNEQTE